MFARTRRLTLRPGWPEDAPELTRAIAHESVATMLARLPWPYTEATARDWLARPRRAGDADCLILAHDGGDATLIGAIGLTRHGDAVDLGYWLTPSAWGHGYATEAAAAMLGIARDALGLARLTSGHFLDNPASGKVLRKLGFRQTGEAPRHCVARDAAVPCAEFELELGARRFAFPAESAT